ncbi:hypothetical protein [Nocardioides sp. B-3]|uniref:hypothetical protein n=1 Tax=Nocardioides sp. B-3 TaxID=2895565 RepID=UPI00215398FA|nr:hypothetical protein [Nocardioides sp. B-3]UUZ57642.1 hypothetical protein LP418_14360 [Nocardioides sp. B-3]
MKKTLVGLFTAVAMMFGVIGLSGSAAVAGPYTGTVPTEVKAKPRPAVSTKPAKVKVVVDTAGNAEPTGWVKIVVRRAGKVVSTKTVRYSDVDVYKLGKLAKGKYTVKLKFTPKGAESVYIASKTKFTLKVA